MRWVALFQATSTAVIVAVVALALPSCGDDDDSVTLPDASNGDSGAGKDVQQPSTDTGGPAVDAGPPPIRCSEADFAAGDFTDGGVFEITFELGANPRQYVNRCITIKVSASVTWAGSFAQHPLEPAGGDSPNPIPFTNQNPANGKLVVTFDKAGTFGFQCAFHPTLMFGAIKVVP